MNYTPIIDELFQALQSGDASKMKALLETNPSLANMENADGLTPLGYGSHMGNQDIVQLLLDHGADVNAVSHSKLSFIPSNTALHAAIAGERKLDVIRLLLSHGANTNLFDSSGHTCLHTAAFHDDNLDMIRLLIEHGADVNANIEGGRSALALAVEQGNHNVAELLRQSGAQ